jgi:hypothetical protein
MNFYITLSICALAFLIIVLTIYGVFYKSILKPFPEYQDQCPKMWSIDISGNCLPPDSNVNTLQLGTGNTPAKALVYTGSVVTSFNPADSSWKSYNDAKNEICGKKSWCKNNKIEWNGISNYNSC